jgi:hypothetical protein
MAGNEMLVLESVAEREIALRGMVGGGTDDGGTRLEPDKRLGTG